MQLYLSEVKSVACIQYKQMQLVVHLFTWNCIRQSNIEANNFILVYENTWRFTFLHASSLFLRDRWICALQDFWDQAWTAINVMCCRVNWTNCKKKTPRFICYKSIVFVISTEAMGEVFPIKQENRVLSSRINCDGIQTQWLLFKTITTPHKWSDLS